MKEVHDEVIASKAWDHSLFLRLLHYAKPHKPLFLGSFLVLFALMLLELAGPWVWRRVLDGPIAASQAAELVDSGTYMGELWKWIGFYAGLMLATLLFRYLEVAQLTRTGQAVIHDLRGHLFRHMQELDLSFFDRQPTGSLVTRVTTDVENLSELFTSGVVVLFFDMLKVVVLLVILFTIQAKLALVVLILTPVLIGISLSFRGGARSAHRVVRARLARLNGYLQEVLQGIRVVQLFHREDRVSRRFGAHLADYFAANKRTIFLFALFYPSITCAVYLIEGTTLVFAGEAMVAGTLTYGQFVQFWFYLAMLVRPIRELGERYNVMQSAFASAERIFDVLDRRAVVRPPAQALELPGAKDADGRPPHIRFEGVSFAYRAGREVITDISFELPPGKTVAIVGETGSGKSTLVNLLLRFYDPTEGRVTFDGVDLRDLDLGSLRKHFGLVLQEDFLFAGTVRENLVMDRDEVDEDSLLEALDTSRADIFIERLESGLDAVVAERGATFSTGERQLLAIARALAARPRIVVLDEATASVDSATEARIEAATQTLLRERSALVVAHRLSTIRRADRILVMHRGRLREEGTHEELLRGGGLYARLYTMQFADQADAAEAV